MKTRELPVGGNRAVLKLRKEGELVRAKHRAWPAQPFGMSYGILLFRYFQRGEADRKREREMEYGKRERTQAESQTKSLSAICFFIFMRINPSCKESTV